MRFLIALILGVLLLETAGTSDLRQTSRQGPSASMSRRTELELNYRIVESKYCINGGMVLVLASEYKNLGKDDLVLFKYALAPFEYRVSRSVEAAKARRYEQVISPMMGSMPSGIKFGDEPPGDYFVILKPGQSFSPVNTVIIPIFAAGANQKRSKDYLNSGKHVLELKTSTWPFDDDHKLKTELQVRWQGFGNLWTEPVWGLPTTFQIDRVTDRALANCDKPPPR